MFKIVFGSQGSEPQLRALLNALLERPPGARIEHVEIVNPTLDKKTVEDRGVLLDVRARDERGIRYNVEVQVARQDHLARRAAYYVSRLHGEQLAKGVDPIHARPTVVLWILDHVAFRRRAELHTTYSLRDSATGQPLTEDIQLHFFELGKFKTRSVDELQDSRDVWMHLLRHGHRYQRGTEPLPAKLMEEEGVADMIEKMRTAMSDEEARSWAFSRDMGQYDIRVGLHEAEQKGLSKGLRRGKREGRKQGLQQGLERGRDEGRQEGLQKGLEQGRDEGLQIANHATAQRMLAEGADIELISRATLLSVDEIRAIAEG